MGKFLIRTGIFIMSTLLAYVVLVCVWGLLAPDFLKKNLNYHRGYNGHMHTRMQEVAHYSDVDLLFLGSSHAYRGFDVREFQKAGFRTFNFGSSAQTPIQTLRLIEKYMPGIRPKFVILEVNPGSFGNDGVESELDMIANAGPDLGALRSALTLNHIKVYNTLIFGFFDRYIRPDYPFSEPVTRKGDTYISGGFVERKHSVVGEMKIYPKKDLKTIGYQVQAFEEIIRYFRENNIDYVLVQAPVTKPYYASIENEKFDSIAASYGRYYNFNIINNTLTDSLHFYDAHHLNQEGVRIFNRNVIQTLTSCGIITSGK